MAQQQSYSVAKLWMHHARKVVSFWRERGLLDGVKYLSQIKTVQKGELKGVDEFGNQYYEDPATTPGRHRWVVYGGVWKRHHVDSSTVPAAWHPWLHHMTDETPIERPPHYPIYALPHQPTAMSQQGFAANYLPPGHMLSTRHTTFGKTGKGASDALDGSYESWQQGGAGALPSTAHPENQPVWATKTERR